MSTQHPQKKQPKNLLGKGQMADRVEKRFVVTRKEIYDELKKIFDPELNINIVDLGLIYGVKVKKGEVSVLMTLTFPGCPLAHVIRNDINDKLRGLDGVKEVKLDITFDPLWDFSKVSGTAKEQLGII